MALWQGCGMLIILYGMAGIAAGIVAGLAIRALWEIAEALKQIAGSSDEITRLNKQCAGLYDAAIGNGQGLLMYEGALVEIRERLEAWNMANISLDQDWQRDVNVLINDISLIVQQALHPPMQASKGDGHGYAGNEQDTGTAHR